MFSAGSRNRGRDTVWEPEDHVVAEEVGDHHVAGLGQHGQPVGALARPDLDDHLARRDTVLERTGVAVGQWRRRRPA